MITGIAHAAFSARDMEKTLAYYCGKLGFRHAFSLADQAGKPWIEYVHVGQGQFLEFFYAKSSEPEGDHQFQHICFQVDDAQATCRALMEKGVEITSPLKQGRDLNVQFWSRDPDGNRIEFMQISDQSPQAQSVR